MAFLLDTLDEKKLAVQRDVVSNERRVNYENRPYGTAFLREADIFFPQPHPYYHWVIGSIPEIQAASMDDLRAFFRQYYAPNNASLVIVGNFDPAQVKALVAKYFGAIPRQPDVPRPTIAQPPLPGVVQETLHDQVAKVARLDLGWVGVKHYDPDEAPGDVLAYILAEGQASRLYQELVERRQIASDVDAGDAAFALGGMFKVEVTVREPHTVAELLPVIDQIVDDVRQRGVTDDEVDRAKRNLVADKLRRLETISGFGGKADLLNQYQTFLGDPGYLAKDLARYRAVTPDAVKAFANRYLVKDRRAIIDVEPASPPSTPTAPNGKAGK
jgi:predicted Zn-dependent peptidase